MTDPITEQAKGEVIDIFGSILALSKAESQLKARSLFVYMTATFVALKKDFSSSFLFHLTYDLAAN